MRQRVSQSEDLHGVCFLQRLNDVGRVHHFVRHLVRHVVRRHVRPVCRDNVGQLGVDQVSKWRFKVGVGLELLHQQQQLAPARDFQRRTGAAQKAGRTE